MYCFIYLYIYIFPLAYVTPDNKTCRFKFSLVGLNQAEFILKAKLRLYMKTFVEIVKSPAHIVSLFVEGSNDNTMLTTEINSQKEGYIEFNVADIFRDVVTKRKINIVIAP